MMQASDKPRHNPNATHQTVGEEAVLINLNTGAYYSLNDTGTMFWELLDGERSIAECAALIAQEYEVEPAVVEADLLELATEFKAEGLIVV
ncbi:MAG TPA: PqqD family protein [Anaerolineae bacterium]|nr:PqqD family protein [Anaerolineae bacterium]HMR63178.1 PqqD family protein [Anaerolineae bacterium]